MSIPEKKRYDVSVGLSLPAKANDAVKKRASTWRILKESLESPKEFRVQSLSVRNATDEDLPKIKRAYETAKKQLEGFAFDAQTPAVRYVPGGADLATKGEEGTPFEHIGDIFRKALLQEGVDDSKIQKSDPHIQLVRPKPSEKAPEPLFKGYDISSKNQIRWKAVPSEQLIMETKTQEPPSDESRKN